MSLQTVEIEAFSGPTSVLIGGGNQPSIVYINQGPVGATGPAGINTWGSITGTLSSQTDLQNALNAKAPIASPTFTGIVTAPRITGRCDGLEVLCKAGLAIAAGQVVYVTGASGNNIVIGLARANAEATSSKTLGISESTLANNATGYVITEGLMTVSISAPAANEGDPIWLSPTTAGSMVFGLANKPSAPNHIVYLGVVTRKTGNNVVEIYVKVQNGAELDELSDVSITNAVAGQALMRGATLWENRSLVSADITDATSAATANTLVKRSSTGAASFTTSLSIGSQPNGSASLIIGNVQDGDAAKEVVGEIVFKGSVFNYIDTTIFGNDGELGITNPTTSGGAVYIKPPSASAGAAVYFSNLTASRIYQFPNATGTVALTDVAQSWSGTQTFSGAMVFTNAARPTSSASGSPAATSLMTRDDSDTRYGTPYNLRVLTDVSATSLSNVNSSDTITLPAGTYFFQGNIVGLTASTTGGINVTFFTNSDTNTTGSVIFQSSSANGTGSTATMTPRNGAALFQYLANAFADASLKACSSIFSGTVTFSTSQTITPRVSQRSVADANNAAILKAGSMVRFIKIA